MAAELQRKFGIQAEMVRGRGGVFDVTMDNEIIYSKKQSGRFPMPGEVEEKVSERVGA